MGTKCSGAAVVLTVLTNTSALWAKAAFVFNPTDAAGVGFNDPTPATPVGGNTGTTLGQQRTNAVRYALDLWGKNIDSPVPIVVDASFAPLDCAGGFGVLAQAGSAGAEYGIAGLEPNLLYVEALADRRVGYDLNPGGADIEASFNGNVRQCFPGVDWYYGLDGQSGIDPDLVYVTLHEIAHGLGFSYLPDPETGQLVIPGMVDPYLQHLLDIGTGRRFDQMSTSERLAAGESVRRVVWDGQYVLQVAPQRLASGAPQLGVNPPLTGFTAALVEANFGLTVPTQAISGGIGLGNPSDGCSELAPLPSPIALLYQGDCNPVDMTYYAQRAGARAVLIADQEAYTPPIAGIEVVAPDLSVFSSLVPTLGISQADANLLRAATSGLTVTLNAVASQRVGADPAGRVYMYASNPADASVSLAHWDPLARPNLLLEPTETLDHPHDLTLEQALLRDIGWEPLCGNGTLDPGEQCDNGPANSDTQPNACRTDCTLPRCGDQVVDTGEQCDRGPNNGTGSCQANCTLASSSTLVSPGGNGGSSNAGLVSSSAPASAQEATASCSCRVQPSASSHGWLLAAALGVLLSRRHQGRGWSCRDGRDGGSRVNPPPNHRA
jgi:MYXO-CTERM domain-containing protein